MENNIEEDIKIVEERIETLNKHISNYEKIDCKTSIYQELVKERDAIENILNAYKKNQNIIGTYEKKCKKHLAFCRYVRKDKADVDEFNQGQEYMCMQFLELLKCNENLECEED